MVLLRGGNATDTLELGTNKSTLVSNFTFFEMTDARLRNRANPNGTTYHFPYDGVLGLGLEP
jgi:hypothetical protein